MEFGKDIHVQVAKNCTAICNDLRQDFKTLETDRKYIISHHSALQDDIVLRSDKY